jgi:hypothetical protein
MTIPDAKPIPDAVPIPIGIVTIIETKAIAITQRPNLTPFILLCPVRKSLVVIMIQRIKDVRY